MNSRVICVLGMHRSGTSCLTGCLEEAGIFLGEVSRENPHNLKGHRENTKIIAMHKRLLHANGASWYSPPRCVRWYPENRHERDAIIRDYLGMPAWGFKDPRTVLALEGWLEALPHLSLAGVIRHPLAVAQSLHKRDNFPIRKGLDLWVHYNERLLTHHRKKPFPVLSFDLEPDVFKERLGAMLRALGLCRDATSLSFFEPELRHQQSTGDDTLPLPVRNLYTELLKLAA